MFVNLWTLSNTHTKIIICLCLKFSDLLWTLLFHHSRRRMNMKQLVKHDFQITSHQKHRSGRISDLCPEGKCCQGSEDLRRPFGGWQLTPHSSSPSLLLPHLKPSWPVSEILLTFPSLTGYLGGARRIQGSLLFSSRAVMSGANRQIQRENKRFEVHKKPRPGGSSVKETAWHRACCPKSIWRPHVLEIPGSSGYFFNRRERTSLQKVLPTLPRFPTGKH